MRIPIGDYPFTSEDRDAINRVMDSGRVSEHKEVRAFEEEFADYIGVKHCVAVNSGTSALICGLRASVAINLIPESSPVVCPALTFIATANAITLSGLIPYFVDVHPDTFSLDMSNLPSDVSAIMPVHLLGYAADLSPIFKKDILLVEDAAEAHGTLYFGQKVGSFGHWSAFSFYIAHTVQAGELGAICTNDGDLAAAARSIKAHGRTCVCKVCRRSEGLCPYRDKDINPRFTSQYVGYNFKPMEFQAALARVQLGRIEDNIQRRKENEKSLSHCLRPLVEEGLIMPHYSVDRNGFRNVPMVYPIVLTKPGYRDRVMRMIEKSGVECRPLFGSVPTQQPAYAWHWQRGQRFPTADYYGANGFYVGCHQYIGKDDISYMSNAIMEGVRICRSK